MTGFAVNGGALLAHSEGSARQSDNFTGLASLLEQARVSDDCFGPIFDLVFQSYKDTLEECQGMAGKAAGYLQELSTELADTAKAYGATEADNASTLDDIEMPSITAQGQLAEEGAATHKSDYQQAAAYGSSWASAAYGLSDDAKDPGDPVDHFFAVYTARTEQLALAASPGQSLIDNGLGWLISVVISPLVNLVLEPAIGDPEQMRATGKGWDKVAEWLNGVADREDARAQATADAWQGEAGDAFRADMAEFAEGARALSGDISGLTDTLELAATIFDTFVQVVVDIIQDFVIGLIVEWLAALAASWITFGGSVAAETGLTASQVAVTGTRLGQKVAELAHRLKPLITRLEKLLESIRGTKLAKTLKSAKDMKVVGKRIKRNKVLNTITSHGDDLGTTSGHAFIGKAATGEQALAQHVVKAGLGYLGPTGHTKIGKAVWTGTLENVPGAVVQYGAGEVYDHVTDDGPGDDERKAAEDRGFSRG
ncbi:WXG100 family type VII secretion target [Actinokineospora inagensis]|uniref:WXG100 family type VII secretion target n=1 Tax=Actinokineospora inagensis TaxID=103730 RepID=UPI000425AF2F|nr:WXG100 family type VII secretion target [Actinokineospora inagensis]